MKLSFVAVLALASAAVAPALAADKIVKIGVLTDLSSLYADDTGLGSVLATEMAVEDSGLTAKGWKIDVISGDHQNKPDIGAGLARKWFDEDKVDMVADVPNSGVGLAVNNVVKEKNGVYLNSAAATSDLTGKACTPNTVHWTYDTYMLAHGTGQAVVKAGGDSWSIPGSSSPPITPSARRCSATPPRSSRPTAARSWAPSMCRSTPPTSRRSCCRRRPRRPR